MSTPAFEELVAKARDAESARRLWDVSAELTGCNWQET